MTAAVDAPYFSVVMPVYNEDRNVVTAVATLTREFEAAQCALRSWSSTTAASTTRWRWCAA